MGLSVTRHKHWLRFIAKKALGALTLLALAGVSFPDAALQAQAAAASPLTFTSSSAELQASFVWARHQALAYNRAATAANGPWYEAALPGRNAFCMRDVSHQAEAGAALGLNAANDRMFHLFARSVAESRDWAGFWEIDGDGQPSKADYVSDNDFWYNLPANFDLLDASIRLWRWTGNDTYRDPDFTRLAQVTMHQFSQRWLIEPGTILQRPRIANRHATEGRFVNDRGIPSYTEETKNFIFGTDLLAAEIAAARSLSATLQQTRDPGAAAPIKQEQQQWQRLLEQVGWSEQQHHYLRTISSDMSGRGSGDVMVLYFGAAGSAEHREAALKFIAQPQYWQSIGIEEESYIPLTLFRYGKVSSAYQVMADLSRPDKPRREYPENSFAVIEAIVSGVMGVQPPLPGDDYQVRSLSQLPKHQTAELRNLAIRGHLLHIAHHGSTWSRLTNVSGTDLVWRAGFSSQTNFLRVDGHRVKANHGGAADGFPYSWVQVSLAPGQAVTVSN